MYLLALLAAVLAIVHGQTKYCCTPDQWNGYVGHHIGTVNSGSPHYTVGNISVAYDYTNRRLATTSSLTEDGQLQVITVISNYQARLTYTIIGSQCNVSTLDSGFNRLCIPDNAISTGLITYGVGSNSLQATVYVIPSDQNSTTLATTTIGNPCAPISEIVYGIQDQVPSIQSMGYHDITPGIANPRVFTPPSSCSQNQQLDPFPTMNTLMQHIHNKISN